MSSLNETLGFLEDPLEKETKEAFQNIKSNSTSKKNNLKRPVFKTMIKGFYVYDHIETSRIEYLFKIHKQDIESLNYLQYSYPTVGLKKHLEQEQKHFQIFREVYELAESDKILKPTSETIMYPIVYEMINFVKKPFRWYSIGPVFRDETNMSKKYFRNKQIKYFFEGHALFKTKEQSQKEIVKILKHLQKYFEKIGLKPQINLRPPEDTFPGAQKTYAFDLLVGSKLVQIYTVHYLGVNFSKVFQKTKTQDLLHGISFGGSERIYGCLEEIYGSNLKWVLPVCQNINFFLKDIDCSEHNDPIFKTKINVMVEKAQNTEKEIQKINRFYEPCFITKIGAKEVESNRYISIDYDTNTKIDSRKQKEYIEQKRKSLIESKIRDFKTVYNDLSKGAPLENIDSLVL